MLDRRQALLSSNQLYTLVETIFVRIKFLSYNLQILGNFANVYFNNKSFVCQKISWCYKRLFTCEEEHILILNFANFCLTKSYSNEVSIA